MNKLFFTLQVFLFLSLNLSAQENPRNNQINLKLADRTKILYVNILDSAGNTVSTNFLTLGNNQAIDSLSSDRIKYDSLVWSLPKIYNDAPASLNYLNEKAFYYAGLDYLRHKTKVFAYIGFPANASSTNKVPAVVLVHGGGGTALASVGKDVE